MITITIGADHRILVANAETGESLDHADIFDSSRETKAALYAHLRTVSERVSSLTDELELELQQLRRDRENATDVGSLPWHAPSRGWDPADTVGGPCSDRIDGVDR